jgi:insulysin
MNTKHIKVWHKQDTTYLVPKGNLFYNFYSNLINASPQNHVMSSLLRDLMSDHLNEYAYYASLAGLDFSVFILDTKLKVEVRGYNDKLKTLTMKVFESLKSLKIREDRFLVFKQRVSVAF